MKKAFQNIYVLFFVFILTFSLSASNKDDKDTYALRQRSRQFNPLRRRGNGAQRFAVLIGQDEYENRPLRTCVNDARKFKNVLIKEMSFNENNIRFYKNHQADSHTLKQSLQQLSRITTKNDFVIFYYSGHGIRTRDNHGNRTTALLLTSGEKVKAKQFRSWISKIKAKTLFIIDSCYSEGMVNDYSERAASRYGDAKVYFRNTRVRPNFYFLTSSRRNQISMTINRLRLSRFTYFLLKAIVKRRGDVNHDGRLSLYEIYTWTRNSTINHGRVYGHRHEPVLIGSQPNSLIITSYNRNSRRYRRSTPREVEPDVNMRNKPAPIVRARPQRRNRNNAPRRLRRRSREEGHIDGDIYDLKPPGSGNLGRLRPDRRTYRQWSGSSK